MVTSLRRTLRPITLTAAAVMALAGFLPAPAQAATAATYRIAVLGDSWASGEGNGSYAAGTGDPTTGCHRSGNAWIYDVVLPNGATVRSAYDNGTASLQFLACQGATTAEITHTNPLSNEGAQLDRMFSSATHIFLSISGNDLKFGDILNDCAWQSVTKCSDVTTAARDSNLPTAIKNLKNTIPKIHAKAPTAEIILTGYAVPVGPHATPWKDNSWLLKNLAFSYNEMEKDLVSTLDDTMNIKFADVTDGFANHEDGENPTDFFGPVQSADNQTRRLHPDSSGEDVIAAAATKKVIKPFSCPTLVKAGATGECVKQIQRSLNAWNSYTTKLSFTALTVDGDFGAKTTAAVKAFQTYRGLTSDGIVGPATKADLFDK